MTHRQRQDPNLLEHLGRFWEGAVGEPGWFPPMVVRQDTASFLPRAQSFVITVQWDIYIDEDYREMRMFSPINGEMVTMKWKRSWLDGAFSTNDGRKSSTKRKESYQHEGKEYLSLAEAAYWFLKKRGGV